MLNPNPFSGQRFNVILNDVIPFLAILNWLAFNFGYYHVIFDVNVVYRVQDNVVKEYLFLITVINSLPEKFK